MQDIICEILPPQFLCGGTIVISFCANIIPTYNYLFLKIRTYFTEKSNFSEFSTQIVRFKVNFIPNIAIFPIFWKSLIECPYEFSVYSAYQNAQTVKFYGKNPKYLGSLYDFLVK